MHLCAHPGYSRLKLTGLKVRWVGWSLYHHDLSSHLPPANPLLFSEQVKHPPASGPQDLLLPQTENSLP